MKFNDFGVNPAKLRNNAKLSAYELSLRIDKNPGCIHKVECWKINVSLRAILQLCEALEIEAIKLFKTL